MRSKNEVLEECKAMAEQEFDGEGATIMVCQGAPLCEAPPQCAGECRLCDKHILDENGKWTFDGLRMH